MQQPGALELEGLGFRNGCIYGARSGTWSEVVRVRDVRVVLGNKVLKALLIRARSSRVRVGEA
jgi:hypothetical protein